MTNTQEIIRWWTSHGQKVPTEGTSEWADMLLTHQQWHAPRNLLIQYEGGGYDGCFWEWNYAYYDNEGEFHNLFASGYNGCETAAELQQYWADHPSKFIPIELDEAGWTKFVEKSVPPHVLGVALWFEKEQGRVLPLICFECGDSYPASELQGGDEHGCGGVASTFDHFVCYRCGGDDE